MYTANLNFCKELHELSGWDSENSWFDEGNGTEAYAANDHDTYQIEHEWGSGNLRCLSPAYDLGYLFRKLESVHLQKHDIRNGIARIEGNWEDRAAQYCIYLFKDGILKKEQS